MGYCGKGVELMHWWRPNSTAAWMAMWRFASSTKCLGVDMGTQPLATFELAILPLFL